MLCTILGQHPDVLCHHELYNPRGVFLALDLRGSELLGEVPGRDADPMGFLERAWRLDLGRRAVGFKMTLRQEARVLEHLLADTSVRKIVLRRHDPLRTFVSERVAERLDQWEVYRPEDLAVNRPRVRVDLEALRAHVTAIDAYYDELARALCGQDVREVDHARLEELSTQRALFQFLGVKPPDEPFIARSVRQNPAPLAALIQDYPEFSRALRGDPLARFLD